MVFKINPFTGELDNVGVEFIYQDYTPDASNYNHAIGTEWYNSTNKHIYKLYDDTKNAALWQQISPIGMDSEENVLAIADASIAPPTEISGDRYILDGSLPVHADWDGAVKDDIVEFDGSLWVATTPDNGTLVFVDDVSTLYIFTTSWNPITAAIPDATTTTKGIASFDGTDFDVTAGAVTLEDNVVKYVVTESGVLTPSNHRFTITGGDGMTVTHSGQTVYPAMIYPSEVNGFIDPVNEVEISFTNVSRTLTVGLKAPSTSYRYRTGSTSYSKSASETIVIDDTEGLHYVYYNGLTLSKTVTWSDDIMLEYAIVAIIYWDKTNAKQLYLGDEHLHGTKMGAMTHNYLHETRGFSLHTGGGLASILVDQTGASNSHAQFGNEATEVYDEDAFFAHTARASTDTIAVYYKSGASASKIWRALETGTYGVITTGTGRAAYNFLTGGNWTQAEVTSGRFVLSHVFTYNDSTRRYGVIQGQAQYTTIVAARNAAKTEISAIILDGLPTAEIKFLGTVIYETSDAYGNAVKSRIRSTDTGASYIDLREMIFVRDGTSLTLTDHGSLTGLTDDDHTQYVLADGTRAMTSLTVGTVTAKTLTCTIQTLTDGANIAWDASLGAYATVTLAGNRTLDNPSNVVAGGMYKIFVKQDGTGGRTLAFGANFKFPGAIVPTISTGISAVDILEFWAETTSALHLTNCIYDSK